MEDSISIQHRSKSLKKRRDVYPDSALLMIVSILQHPDAHDLEEALLLELLELKQQALIKLKQKMPLSIQKCCSAKRIACLPRKSRSRCMIWRRSTRRKKKLANAYLKKTASIRNIALFILVAGVIALFLLLKKCNWL